MFFLQNCINIYAAYQLDLRRGVRCLNQMDIFFLNGKTNIGRVHKNIRILKSYTKLTINAHKYKVSQYHYKSVL